MMELAYSSSTAWAPLSSVAIYEPAGRRGTDGGRFRPSAKSSANSSPFLESSDYGSSSAFSALLGEEVQPAFAEPSPALLKIAERLRELSFMAHEDGVRPSANSLRDMQAFLAVTPLKSRPSIYLQDTGNYRVIWRNVYNEQVAIQFMGDESAQFVIFKKMPNSRMARVAGSCPLSSLHRQIEANRAESLLA